MREVVLQVRIGADDNECFKAAAAAAGMKLGSWARETLLGAVAGAPPPQEGKDTAIGCAVKSAPEKKSRVSVPRREKRVLAELAQAAVAVHGAGAVVVGPGVPTGESKFSFGHFNYEYRRADGSTYWTTVKPS